MCACGQAINIVGSHVSVFMVYMCACGSYILQSILIKSELAKCVAKWRNSFDSSDDNIE